MATKLLENIKTGELVSYTPERAGEPWMALRILTAVPMGEWHDSKWSLCQQFLNDLLREHPVPATEAQAAALAAGFSPSTIRSAKQRYPAPIYSRWVGNIGGGRWWWYIEDDTDATPE